MGFLFKQTTRQIRRVGDCCPPADHEEVGGRNSVTVWGGRVLTNCKMHLTLQSLCPHTTLLGAERTLLSTAVKQCRRFKAGKAFIFF